MRPWVKAVVFAGPMTLALLGAAVIWAGKDKPATSADYKNAALVAHGSRVYADHCASCHGANLEGQPDWMKHLPDGKLPAPPHDPSGHTWHHSDGRLFLIIKDGLGDDYPTDMPLFKDVLSDHDIWATLAFIKSTWPEEIRAKQPKPRPAPPAN
jgi:mono/diheme cytochrome c family protein